MGTRSFSWVPRHAAASHSLALPQQLAMPLGQRRHLEAARLHVDHHRQLGGLLNLVVTRFFELKSTFEQVCSLLGCCCCVHASLKPYAVAEIA